MARENTTTRLIEQCYKKLEIITDVQHSENPTELALALFELYALMSQLAAEITRCRADYMPLNIEQLLQETTDRKKLYEQLCHLTF